MIAENEQTEPTVTPPESSPETSPSLRELKDQLDRLSKRLDRNQASRERYIHVQSPTEQTDPTPITKIDKRWADQYQNLLGEYKQALDELVDRAEAESDIEAIAFLLEKLQAHESIDNPDLVHRKQIEFLKEKKERIEKLGVGKREILGQAVHESFAYKLGFSLTRLVKKLGERFRKKNEAGDDGYEEVDAVDPEEHEETLQGDVAFKDEENQEHFNGISVEKTDPKAMEFHKMVMDKIHRGTTTEEFTELSAMRNDYLLLAALDKIITEAYGNAEKENDVIAEIQSKFSSDLGHFISDRGLDLHGVAVRVDQLRREIFEEVQNYELKVDKDRANSDRISEKTKEMLRTEYERLDNYEDGFNRVWDSIFDDASDSWKVELIQLKNEYQKYLSLARSIVNDLQYGEKGALLETVNVLQDPNLSTEFGMDLEMDDLNIDGIFIESKFRLNKIYDSLFIIIDEMREEEDKRTHKNVDNEGSSEELENQPEQLWAKNSGELFARIKQIDNYEKEFKRKWDSQMDRINNDSEKARKLNELRNQFGDIADSLLALEQAVTTQNEVFYQELKALIEANFPPRFLEMLNRNDNQGLLELKSALVRRQMEIYEKVKNFESEGNEPVSSKPDRWQKMRAMVREGAVMGKNRVEDYVAEFRESDEVKVMVGITAAQIVARALVGPGGLVATTAVGVGASAARREVQVQAARANTAEDPTALVDLLVKKIDSSAPRKISQEQDNDRRKAVKWALRASRLGLNVITFAENVVTRQIAGVDRKLWALTDLIEVGSFVDEKREEFIQQQLHQEIGLVSLDETTDPVTLKKSLQKLVKSLNQIVDVDILIQSELVQSPKAKERIAELLALREDETAEEYFSILQEGMKRYLNDNARTLITALGSKDQEFKQDPKVIALAEKLKQYVTNYEEFKNQRAELMFRQIAVGEVFAIIGKAVGIHLLAEGAEWLFKDRGATASVEPQTVTTRTFSTDRAEVAAPTPTPSPTREPVMLRPQPNLEDVDNSISSSSNSTVRPETIRLNPDGSQDVDDLLKRNSVPAAPETSSIDPLELARRPVQTDPSVINPRIPEVPLNPSNTLFPVEGNAAVWDQLQTQYADNIMGGIRDALPSDLARGPIINALSRIENFQGFRLNSSMAGKIESLASQFDQLFDRIPSIGDAMRIIERSSEGANKEVMKAFYRLSQGFGEPGDQETIINYLKS